MCVCVFLLFQSVPPMRFDEKISVLILVKYTFFSEHLFSFINEKYDKATSLITRNGIIETAIINQLLCRIILRSRRREDCDAVCYHWNRLS